MDLNNFMPRLKGLAKVSLLAIIFMMLCLNVMPVNIMASSVGQPDLGDGTTDGSASSDGSPQSTDYLIANVNYDDSSLNLNDPASDERISHLETRPSPMSLAVQPGTMNAAVLTDIEDHIQYIQIVNMSTRQVYEDIALLPADQGGIGIIGNEGCVDHMWWRPDGEYLYVVTDTFLSVINAKNYYVIDNFDEVGSRVAADISPDGSTILLFRKISDHKYNIDHFNTTSNLIDKSTIVDLDFDATNVGPLRFSPMGTKAYAFIDDMGIIGFIGVEPNLVTIDTNTLNITLAKAALPTIHAVSSTNRMDLEISPDGERLYMLYSACRTAKATWSKILVYNLSANAYEKTIYSDGREIGGIALSPDGSKLYAANYCNYFSKCNSITILNASTGDKVGSISETGKGPIDVKVVRKG